MVLVLHEAGDTQMKSQASSHVSFLATSRRWNEMFTVAVNQSVSPSASLTFWAGLVFVVGTLLSIMGCLAAPLTSTHKRPVASLPPLAVPTKCVSRNHQTCLGGRFAPGWNLCSDWTPPVRGPSNPPEAIAGVMNRHLSFTTLVEDATGTRANRLVRACFRPALL